jgi:hypothetical protein
MARAPAADAADAGRHDRAGVGMVDTWRNR